MLKSVYFVELLSQIFKNHPEELQRVETIYNDAWIKYAPLNEKLKDCDNNMLSAFKNYKNLIVEKTDIPLEIVEKYIDITTAGDVKVYLNNKTNPYISTTNWIKDPYYSKLSSLFDTEEFYNDTINFIEEFKSRKKASIDCMVEISKSWKNVYDSMSILVNNRLYNYLVEKNILPYQNQHILNTKLEEFVKTHNINLCIIFSLCKTWKKCYTQAPNIFGNFHVENTKA